MFDGLNPRHIRLVGTYWMRFSVRTGGGLMALFLALVTGLSVAQIFIMPVEEFMKQAPGVGHTPGQAAQTIDRISQEPAVARAVNWLTGEDDAQVEYLLTEQPALLSVIWLMLLVCFPFVTCVGAFNQTAGDIGNRGLRYLLLRTERSNVYLGRALGTLLFSVASIVLLMFLVILYVGLKFNIYPLGDLLSSGVNGFVALLFLSLPYMALCGWFSSMFDSAFASLAVCLLVVLFPVIFIKLADMAADADLEWMQKLMPWGWKFDLLSGDVGTKLLAIGVMLGFTLFFTVLGLRSFHKRDL